VGGESGDRNMKPGDVVKIKRTVATSQKGWPAVGDVGVVLGPWPDDARYFRVRLFRVQNGNDVKDWGYRAKNLEKIT
jgi:hypothetical protein